MEAQDGGAEGTSLEALTFAMEQLALERLENRPPPRENIRSLRRRVVTSADDYPDLVAGLRLFCDLFDTKDPDATRATLASPSDLASAASAIRRPLSQPDNPPFDLVSSVGGVRTLARLVCDTLLTEPTVSLVAAVLQGDALDDVRASVGHDALWALNNLASASQELTAAVAEEADAMLVAIASSTELPAEIAELACWCIGNCAGDGPTLRDRMNHCGAVDAVAGVVERHATDLDQAALQLSVLRTATWTLSNLVRFKPSPPPSVVEPVATLAHSLLMNVSGDDEVLSDALWCFAYAIESSCASDVMQFIVSDAAMLAGITSVLARTENRTAMAAALRIVGNLVTGDDMVTAATLDAGVLPIVVDQLRSGAFGRMASEGFWFLSNVAAGTDAQTEQLFDAGGHVVCLAVLAEALPSANDTLSVKRFREAAFTITNILATGQVGAKVLSECDGLRIVASALATPTFAELCARGRVPSQLLQDLLGGVGSMASFATAPNDAVIASLEELASRNVTPPGMVEEVLKELQWHGPPGDIDDNAAAGGEEGGGEEVAE